LEDNIITYRQASTGFAPQPTSEKASNLTNYIIAGDYLDDKIGTIKFWNLSTGAIPQGWQQVADSNEKFVRCANTYAATGSTFGTTGTNYTSIDMIAIERFE
jgi:hypothetical protein